MDNRIPVSPANAKNLSTKVENYSMSDATLDSSVFVDASDAITFASSLLTGQGVSAEHAAAIATCLVQADLRGVQTHGMSRLPIYVKRVKRGLVNPTPSMKLTKPNGHVDMVDFTSDEVFTRIAINPDRN